METLADYLRGAAAEGLLPWQQQRAAMERFSISCAEVEGACLEQGILPARYQRNRSLLSCTDQLRLFRSSVAVIGCGGLGGYVIEELARLGVGRIIAIDPDVFEEHNLNRQILSSVDLLGRHKVHAALDRVERINPAVTLVPYPHAFGQANGPTLLRNANLAIDGLDSIKVRLQLARCCAEAKIPLVHGAIAGWYGQVATQFPGEKTLETIFSQGSPDKGVEKSLGNPSFTPAVVASLEVAEACKILLDKGAPLRERLLSIDLLEMEFVELPAAPVATVNG